MAYRPLKDVERLFNGLRYARRVGWFAVIVALLDWAGRSLTAQGLFGPLSSITKEILLWPFLTPALIIVGFGLVLAPRWTSWAIERGLFRVRPFGVQAVTKGSIVYLEVVNYSPDTDFQGEVRQIRGVREDLSPPWVIEWRNHNQRRRKVDPVLPHKLTLASGDGKGDGVLIDPPQGARQPGEFRFHVWDGTTRTAHISADPNSDAFFSRNIEVEVQITGEELERRTVTVLLGFRNTRSRHIRATLREGGIEPAPLPG
jgi:hypothetical protein